MTIKLPPDYYGAREELRSAELNLMQQREQVAELRRKLPPGPVVDDYVFQEGPSNLSQDGPIVDVRLSELCSAPGRPLVLYHFMFGKMQEHACPTCSMWADGWEGAIRHVADNVDFAVVAAAPIHEWRALARERGWTNLRLLSAAGSSFKLDLGGEDEAGYQSPFLSVYERDGEAVRLSYSGGAHIEGEHWRGVDLLSPVWHILDLTRKGREDWMPNLDY